MKTRLLLSLSFLFSLAACSVPFDDLRITGSGDIPGFNFQDAALNFKTVQQTSLSSCVRCHAGGKLDLRDPAVVVQARESILNAVNKGTMPPKSSGMKALTPCETQILETWIDDQIVSRKSNQKVSQLAKCSQYQKAPVAKPVDLSTLEPSFANVKAQIFAFKCLECHQEIKSKGKTNLETIESIEAKGLLTPFPEQSKIYQRAHRRGKGQMPPVSSGIPVLTESEMAFVKRWLEKESHDRGFDVSTEVSDEHQP